MDKVLIIYEEIQEKDLDNLRRAWKDYQVEIIEQHIDGDKRAQDYVSVWDEEKPDFMCSFDMAGFQLETLAGGASYNLYPIIQLHIVKEADFMLLYGKEDFALNLNLFLPRNGTEWEEKYEHIPNLYTYEPLKGDETDYEKIKEMVSFVVSERNEYKNSHY